MSARKDGREFVRALMARRDDPYEGADLNSSRLVTAALLGLSSLLAAVMLTFEAPDDAIGAGGWALAGAVIVVGLGGAALVARRSPSFDDLLVVAYGGVAGVAVLNWLAGGGASGYAQLF